MKKQVLFFCIFLFSFFNVSGQVAHCVHGTGIPYLLDAFLGSLGACNCEKFPVYLNSFPNCNNNPYVLEFEDNFDGTALDTSKWGIQPWGQGALEHSAFMEVNLLDNVSVSNGVCYITAKKENVQKRAVNWLGDAEILKDGLPNLRTYYYTSSNLWTKETFFHGKYEIKCRLPKGKGFWPAFWMFGGERWNEIDVFDSYSGTSELITSIGHDFDDTGKSNGCNATKKGLDMSQWHTYACIFDFDRITFLVDDEIIRVIHRIISNNNQPLKCGDDIATGTYFQLKSYPIERMHIIMNLALIRYNQTGSFIPVDESTPFPSALEIEYVRKWKREPINETLLIVPNPTNSTIFINSNVSLSKIEIYDVNCKLIFRCESPDLMQPIDLTTLPNSVYFLKANTPNGIKSIKFIKSTP